MSRLFRRWLIVAALSLFSFSTVSLPAGADHDPWAGVIQCESGGNPSASSGPYSGLFQFDTQTWNGVASRHAPHLVGVWPGSASVADQYLMANALLSERGTQPWPHCGRFYSGPHPTPPDPVGSFLQAVEADPVRWYLHNLWLDTQAYLAALWEEQQ